MVSKNENSSKNILMDKFIQADYIYFGHSKYGDKNNAVK